MTESSDSIVDEAYALPVFFPLDEENSLDRLGVASFTRDGNLFVRIDNAYEKELLRKAMNNPRVLGLGFVYVPDRTKSDGKENNGANNN